MSNKLPKDLQPSGFEIPQYEYKGMPIYTSNEIPENEIHMYDTVTGKMTLLQIPPKDEPVVTGICVDIPTLIKEEKERRMLEKIVFSIVSLFVCLCSTVEAAPRFWGIDQLGAAKYSKVVEESHPVGFALGIFTQRELFGDGYPVVDRSVIKRSIPLVRYNLRWSDSHSFSKRDFPLIVAEAKRGLWVINKYPQVECQVSGATEHQLNQRDATELSQKVLAVLPERCVYVNNPWTGRGAFVTPGPRVINEVHGKDAQRPKIGGRFNWSADGSDVFDFKITNVKNRLADADVFFFWASQNNGRRNADDPTPRPQRKFWPTPQLEKMMAFLATDQGQVRLPSNYLVKPKSDQHAVPPKTRELKPVFILPNGGDTIQLKAGVQTFTSMRKEPFDDGRFRYYFPMFGYEIAAIAKASVFDVLVKGKKAGTANPGFRQGAER